MQSRKSQKESVDLDSRQNPLMTVRTVRYYCQKEGLSEIPEHNDKLYLQFKGFTQIVPGTMAQFHNIGVLWLNNNSISAIQGLQSLLQLTSLVLNNNFISRIQGLSGLERLQTLNLSHNKIELIEGLEGLGRLSNINLSTNFITLPKSLAGLEECENLSSIDLSQNQIENSEEAFQQIIRNINVGCLYLKATPLSRGFRNYRKRFIANLKRLKFLDDRPVLEKDHRLSEAWLKGGSELEETEKASIALEKQKRQEEESILRQSEAVEAQDRPKVEGFIADIKETSIKIMNIEDEEEEERIISRYFKREREQIEKNKQRIRQEEEQKQANLAYYQTHEAEAISEKVHEILGHSEAAEEGRGSSDSLELKWKKPYEKILEALLLRYKFDFSEVQPSFNMLLANVNKKLMRPPVRFQMAELRRKWTQIEVSRRKGKP